MKYVKINNDLLFMETEVKIVHLKFNNNNLLIYDETCDSSNLRELITN